MASAANVVAWKLIAAVSTELRGASPCCVLTTSNSVEVRLSTGPPTSKAVLCVAGSASMFEEVVKLSSPSPTSGWSLCPSVSMTTSSELVMLSSIGPRSSELFDAFVSMVVEIVDVVKVWPKFAVEAAFLYAGSDRAAALCSYLLVVVVARRKAEANSALSSSDSDMVKGRVPPRLQ